MTCSTIESELGRASRHQCSVGNARHGLLSGVEGRVGSLWRIKQAPEEIQGGNTQCEHPERRSL